MCRLTPQRPDNSQQTESQDARLSRHSAITAIPMPFPRGTIPPEQTLFKRYG